MKEMRDGAERVRTEETKWGGFQEDNIKMRAGRWMRTEGSRAGRHRRTQGG